MRRLPAPRRTVPAAVLAVLVGLPGLPALPAAALPLSAPVVPTVITARSAGAVSKPAAPAVLYRSDVAGPRSGGRSESPSVVAGAALTVVPGSAGPALSTWQVSYTGFTPQARAAFQAAVDTWASIVASPVPITVEAVMADLGDPQLLGQTGTATVPLATGGTTTVYPLALGNALLGRDLSSTIPDISSEFNTIAPGLYFGTDGRPPVGQTDFETIVLHELGHGLGFLGGVTSRAGVGYNAPPTAQPLVYDNCTRSPAGRFLSQTNGTLALGDQLSSGQVTWTGPAATRRNGGIVPLLYAPSTYEPGSSYSHLDEVAYPRGTANSLMTPYLSTEEVIRDPGPITRGLLQDIGWTIDSNPSGSCATVPPPPPPAPAPAPAPAPVARGDLFLAAAAGTASGQVEVHALSRSSQYKAFCVHASSALGVVDPATTQFMFGSFDGTGKRDLYVVQTSGTGSGRVEVHVLSAASGYQQWVLHVATPLSAVAPGQWQFRLSTPVSGGAPDLVGVLTAGGGSGRVELHALSRASNFTIWSAHVATALSPGAAGAWDYLVGPSRAGAPAGDLIGVTRGATGSGMTEVHVLSQASGYAAFSLHAATPLSIASSPTQQFSVADVDGDGSTDLVLTKTAGTGSGQSEVHTLSGTGPYQNWLDHAATGLGPVDPRSWRAQALS